MPHRAAVAVQFLQPVVAHRTRRQCDQILVGVVEALRRAHPLRQ